MKTSEPRVIRVQTKTLLGTQLNLKKNVFELSWSTKPKIYPHLEKFSTEQEQLRMNYHPKTSKLNEIEENEGSIKT